MLFFVVVVAFPENKPFEASDGKVVSTSNHWDKAKNNEVSVTFTLSSAAAKVLSHIIAPCLSFLYFPALLNLNYFKHFFPETERRHGAHGPAA